MADRGFVAATSRSGCVKRAWPKIILAPLQFGGAVGSSKTMFTNSDVTIISLSLLFREVWSDFRGHLRFAPK
ncbi:MAG: hypothetical protein JWM99_1285 [Verrucomicrobiales bacterium]|nr:hypothetical protein [Verrucomicrobiales bacterium]